MKKNRFKIVALILVFAMSISLLGVTPVYAEDDGLKLFEYFEETIRNREQSKKDAQEDSYSQGRSAGNWNEIIYDGLPWNKIHNSVQKFVRKKTPGAIEKEYNMDYGQYNDPDKIKTKSGRADIVIVDEKEKRHIYEVKPYSFSEGEKRLRAETQLEQYVLCDPFVNVKGGANIPSGYFRLITPVLRLGKLKFVVYDIEYIVEDSEGLIFYKFQRYDDKSKAPEYEMGLVFQEELKTKKVKQNAMEKILEIGNEATDAVQKIDWPKVFFLVATAVVFYRACKIISQNPEASNSVAITMMVACEEFLSKISKAVSNGYSNANVAEINEAMDDYLTVMDACVGPSFFDEAEKWFEADDSEKISDIIKSIRALSSKYYEACDAQPPIDPLVIDLGASGIELHSMENGVYFDLDNNGFAEKTAWIGTEDGFLALDRDGNGKIENGGELFGDQIVLSNGEKSTSGFEVLTELDYNNDGKIDSSDEIFPQLLVWTDVNHNGISEPGELKNLSSFGIKSISLEHEKISFTDEETGARIAETAEVEIETGTDVATIAISEFWFPVNVGDTTHGGIAVAGNIPEINRAIASDETGELEELFFMFCESKDIAYKRYFARQIMYFISGAKDIDKGSRGGNINAKELKVVEQFMGRKFEGVGGENPNVNAAVILKELYNDTEEYYYTMLNMYAGLGGYLNLTYEYQNDNGENVLELSFIYQFFDIKISEGEDIDYLVYDLGLYLKLYDESHGTNYYDEYKTHYASISLHYADIVAMTNKSSLYVADTDNENCYGNDDSDIMFGEDGSNNISTGAGSDIIVGGKGNDILSGETGNDTYMFNVGDGEDKIYEAEDGQTKDEEDKIVFGYGIAPESIRLERVKYDLVIYYGEGDKITINQVYGYPDERNFVENIEFSDGTKWGLDDIATHIGPMYGTEESERMDGFSARAGYSGNEVFYAGAGDDTVYASDGDDILYGEEGNDVLYGSDGNDILCGGKGNDMLSGETGNDTYMFNVGDGEDKIYEAEDGQTKDEEDKIVFGYGIVPESIRLERVRYNLVIYYGEGDKITINQVYGYPDERNFVENIEFSDGTKWGLDDIATHIGPMYGTEESERMDGFSARAGYSGNEVFYAGAGDDTVYASDGDDILYGEEGNDVLYGSDGNDILCGGKGNDTLDGGAGNDTYLFEIGDGTDEISDHAYVDVPDMEDKIVFGYGIAPESIRLERVKYDLVIYYGEGDKITINQVYGYPDERNFVENIEFSDGTKWGLDDIATHIGPMYGTEESERMDGFSARAGYSGNEVFYAGAGDDAVYASDGDDILYGEEGNDILYGSDGNDILCGGKGNDTLDGGTGNDIYLFEIGDGTDEISDHAYVDVPDMEDKIIFGEGITPESIRLERVRYNLVIYYGEGDKITINQVYGYPDGRNFIEYIEFSDGTLWNFNDIEAHLGV